MRIHCLASLLAIFLLPVGVLAQSDSRQSSGRNWLSRIFQKPAKPGKQTLLLPDAPSRLRGDQTRETWLERRSTEQRIADDKKKILTDLRRERDRSVATAIARAATAKAFAVPIARARSTTGPVAVDPGTTASSSFTTDTDPYPASPPPPSRPDTTPASTPRPVANTPKATPPSNAVTLPDRGPKKPPQSNTIDDAAPAAASTKRHRPGMFALILIGMFLLPSAGVALLLVGAAHLRSHSFFSGSTILAVGCSLLWGAWSLAHLFDPAALTRPETAAPRPATDDANLRPMQALQPGMLWNNEG
jgi:hypothetical protein